MCRAASYVPHGTSRQRCSARTGHRVMRSRDWRRPACACSACRSVTGASMPLLCGRSCTHRALVQCCAKAAERSRRSFSRGDLRTGCTCSWRRASSVRRERRRSRWMCRPPVPGGWYASACTAATWSWSTTGGRTEILFTGIVEEVGRVERVSQVANGRALRIAARRVLENVRDGDSIAVDGVCLTVTRHDPGGFEVEAIGTTLSRTTIGQLVEGDEVNLERALALGDRLGGHLVQG